MKARMRTIYTVTSTSGTQWRGDCPRWGNAPLILGYTMIKTRVLWVGPGWRCACPAGTHA